MAYLNVEEIEAALEALATSHPGVTELIILPNRTSEGRLSHALRVGPPDTQDANTILFTGGLHACEWVPPDALVNLAADLLDAHARGTGLRYGGQRFSADNIRGVVEGLQLVVFPCVNPDGRKHSQTHADEALWRKNRRRVGSGSDPQCVGVDVNRNFDALWDFRRHFAEDSHVSASDNPCHPLVYVGPSAESEAETRNVVSLIQRYPRLRWFVDVHSHVPAIFYSWGFDANQSSEPNMSFRNPAFDGQRGRRDDTYREFIPSEDLQAAQNLAAKLNDAIKAASGMGYAVEQAFTLYPTSGASDDYAYSRHFVQPASSKILSFTLECGHSFQPLWPEAENIIREVCSGLTALCVEVIAPSA
jgi:murein tripeptide amidase MpaA